MLKIYNTLSRQKEIFKPIEPDKVSMYVCGMTVYDLCHVGHARVMVIFDMIARHLRHSDFDVNYVRNITDIDDKIIKRANENNESITELTERFIEAMNQDSEALGVIPPDMEPKATLHMDQIIDMISTLIEKKHAYVGSNNDVYFDISSYDQYGKLSGKNIDELQAGERVEVQEEKDDPLDFVLWKAAKADEPSWPSPWGDGRPGWHIECSAMSTHCLGNHFDIHGGGQDLQFPHHENEIAQSQCATGETFANVWVHNGFVRIDEEKMSKSLGNFFTVREVLKEYQAEVIRFFILSSHYRSPLNYSTDNLDEAKSALSRLYTALRDATVDNDVEPLKKYVDEFNRAMDDDFNSPKAISILHELARESNRITDKSSKQATELAATLKFLAGVLGLLQDDPQAFLQGKANASDNELDEVAIQKLIDERNQAKTEKNYAKADEIRDQLVATGITLEDTPQGTIWRRN
ncbi:MAG TPA: cysteine--tRNA ligase [Thiotrichaceae bacterium]|nr:cysteine--tRNA ligase [Thiotrichaceae bacterium]HIM07775.1 cysteine--tRNA ligase [Gammaproteobacteria bacterium]